MAIAVAQEASAEDWSGGTASSVAVTLTVAAGSSLVVFAGAISDDFASTVTASCADSKSQTYTPLDTNTYSNNYRIFSFLASNVASGSTTVTVTFSHSSVFFAAWVVEVSGGATSPLDGHNKADQSLGSGTNNVTVSATNATQPALVVALSVAASGAAPAAGTGFTSTKTAMGGQGRSENKRVTTATSQAATFSAGGSDEFGTLIVILDEAGTSGNTMTVAATAPGPTCAAALVSTDKLTVAVTAPAPTMAAGLASTDVLTVAATVPVATMAASLAIVSNVITIAATAPAPTMAAALASVQNALAIAATAPAPTAAGAMTSTDAMIIAAAVDAPTCLAVLTVASPAAPPGITMPIPYTARMT